MSLFVVLYGALVAVALGVILVFVVVFGRHGRDSKRR